MTKFELLAVFSSLKKLHERGMPDAAEEVIDEVIAEAKADSRRKGSKRNSSPEPD